MVRSSDNGTFGLKGTGVVMCHDTDSLSVMCTYCTVIEVQTRKGAKQVHGIG